MSPIDDPGGSPKGAILERPYTEREQMRQQVPPGRRHTSRRKRQGSGHAGGLPSQPRRIPAISAPGVEAREAVGDLRPSAQLCLRDRRTVAADRQWVLSVPSRAGAGTARQSQGERDRRQRPSTSFRRRLRFFAGQEHPPPNDPQLTPVHRLNHAREKDFDGAGARARLAGQEGLIRETRATPSALEKIRYF